MRITYEIVRDLRDCKQKWIHGVRLKFVRYVDFCIYSLTNKQINSKSLFSIVWLKRDLALAWKVAFTKGTTK